MWHGPSATECEGRLDDFSTLTFLLKSNAKYIKGRKIGIKELFTNEFTIGIDDLKFWFQYKLLNPKMIYFKNENIKK